MSETLSVWDWEWWTSMDEHSLSPLRYAILAAAITALVVILAYK